jgi:hypothetical protein
MILTYACVVSRQVGDAAKPGTCFTQCFPGHFELLAFQTQYGCLSAIKQIVISAGVPEAGKPMSSFLAV